MSDAAVAVVFAANRPAVGGPCPRTSRGAHGVKFDACRGRWARWPLPWRRRSSSSRRSIPVSGTRAWPPSPCANRRSRGHSSTASPSSPSRRHSPFCCRGEAAFSTSPRHDRRARSRSWSSRLRRENAGLHRANAILMAASGVLAAETRSQVMISEGVRSGYRLRHTRAALGGVILPQPGLHVRPRSGRPPRPPRQARAVSRRRCRPGGRGRAALAAAQLAHEARHRRGPAGMLTGCAAPSAS